MYRVLRRLDEAVLEQLLSAVVPRRVPPPDRQTTVVVDATGLAPGAICTFFVKRAKDRGEGSTWRHWRKWTMAAAVDRRWTVAQTARQRVPVSLVRADAECDRERHHQPIRQTLQAQRVIPAKRASAP